VYVQFLFLFFRFTSEKHTGLERRENGQLWNGYTSDEVPQGEQSVWILKKKKNSEYAVFLSCVVFGEVLNGFLPFKSAKDDKHETRLCGSA